MYRVALYGLITLLPALGFPASASAQSYQRFSDGLVSVHAHRTTTDHPVGLEVCATLIRPEKACPVEVRLLFRSASGQILGQSSPVLHPTPAAPACTKIGLSADAKEMARWEIARFRCQRPEAGALGAVSARTGG